MMLPTPEYVDRLGPSHIVHGALNLLVWGPGVGEACVLVMPDGRVGVVDGCREKKDPVLEFIQALTDNPKIAFVCLTHPHADHYSGLGRLIEKLDSRVQRVASINMMSNDRFRKSLIRWIEGETKPRTPTEPSRAGLERFINQFKRAAKNRPVSYLSGCSTMLPGEVSIQSCAPAANDLSAAQNAILKFQTKARKTATFNPNRVSAALTVQWKEAGILLGGDLEHKPGWGEFSGWQAAMEWIEAKRFPVVKAPHHGSHTGYHEPMWASAHAELVIVTPFKNALGKQPPTQDDLRTLRQHAPVVLTSPPAWLEQGPRLRADLPMLTQLKDKAGVLTLTAPPSGNDRYNAVSVSLNKTGQIQRIVLAGSARFYGTNGLPLAKI